MLEAASLGTPCIALVSSDDQRGQVELLAGEGAVVAVDPPSADVVRRAICGGCISCAAKLLSGAIDQSAGVALNGRQHADGYVLLCIARPLTDCALDVGVESHDKLYRNPFASPLAPHELKPDIATALKDGP